MTVTFFGHKDTPEAITTTLENTITNLIINHNADMFYIGNNGNFDRYATGILSRLETTYPHIKFFIVLTTPNDKTALFPDHTVYPEGLETTPKHLLILKRNQWMISKADTVVTYLTHTTTNTYKLVNLAEAKGKTIINIAKI